MTENPWDQWLRNWLNRNPVRKPTEELQRDYVRQVMEKIEPAPAPAREPAWRPWLQPPRLAFAGALAAAALVIAVYRGPIPAAVLMEQDGQVLLEAGELALLIEASLEDAILEQDRIVLAEAVEQEKWWSDFVRDSELLEELEEAPTAGQEKVADEELLQEIRAADEQEMALS